MSKTYDQIIVIDIESTCWNINPPPDQISEIIEIGVCVLELKNFRRIKKESILVRPTASEVSPFCTSLTTLTQDQVMTGIPFADACKHLNKEYGTKNRPWASYGYYDWNMFQSQCALECIKVPFSTSHINVKALFAASMGLNTEVGMVEALSLIGLPLEGTHHRGHDDAWNIAGILGRLLTRERVGSRATVNSYEPNR